MSEFKIRDGNASWWPDRPVRSKPARPLKRAPEPQLDVVPYENTRCPECGSIDTSVTRGTRRPHAQLVYRYHTCACGHKFKSLEDRQQI